MTKLFLKQWSFVFFLVVGIVAVLGAVAYTNQYGSSRAQQPPVTVTFAPNSGNFPANTPQSLTVFLKTGVASQKISGFDLSFTASSVARITNISPPTSTPNGNFVEITRSITPQLARVVYTSSLPEAQLPQVVQLTLSFDSSGTGNGAIALNQTTSQVTGNIVGDTYAFGSVDSGNFTFTGTGGQPTATPQLTLCSSPNRCTIVNSPPGVCLDGSSPLYGYCTPVGAQGKENVCCPPQIPSSTPRPTTGGSSPFADITLNPKTGTLSVSTDQVVEITLQTVNAANKISTFELNFTTSGVAQIVSVSAPTPLPVGVGTVFAEITRIVNTQSARLVYASSQPAAQLARGVVLRVTLRGSAAGSGRLVINRQTSQIAGNIPGEIYTLRTVDQGSYTFTGGQATVTPTAPPIGGAGPFADILLTPKTGNFPAQTNQQVRATLKTVTSGHKISGFDLILSTEGVTEIVGIGQPQLPAGTSATFTQITRQIAAKSARIAYVSSSPAAQLPAEVFLRITVKGTTVGNGSLVINQQTSQISGNVPSDVYTLRTVDRGNYTFTAGTQPTATPPQGTSPTPPLSPHFTPPPGQQCEADIDDDGDVDIDDIDEVHKEIIYKDCTKEKCKTDFDDDDDIDDDDLDEVRKEIEERCED